MRKQRRLVEGPADQLEPKREPGVREPARQRQGGQAAHVRGIGETAIGVERALLVAVGETYGLLARPDRRDGRRRRHDRVDVLEGGDQLLRDQPPHAVCLDVVGRGGEAGEHQVASVAVCTRAPARAANGDGGRGRLPRS